MKDLNALAAGWRTEAERLRSRYGANSLARLCDTHAEELEAALRRELDATLDPDAAASYSGYSKSQLRRLQADGVLENVGRKGRPRYRRRDLPVKAGRPPALANRDPGERQNPSAASTTSAEMEARLDARFRRKSTRA